MIGLHNEKDYVVLLIKEWKAADGVGTVCELPNTLYFTMTTKTKLSFKLSKTPLKT